MAEYATRLENGADTADRMRLADAIALQHKGPLNARSGLRNDGGGVVTVVAGTMGVQVTKFSGWVDGTVSDAQGGYPFVCDATKSLTLDDGHATLSRTDVIVARIQDDAFDSSGSTTATVEVVKGTAGSGVPTLPANTLPLQNVTVPAGLSAGTGGLSSGNLSTDRREYLSGGVLRVASATERDALTLVEGQVVYRADTNVLEVYNGTSWDQYATTPAALSVYRNTAQTIPNTTWTAVSFNTEVKDTHGMWSSGTNITVARDGFYDVVAGASFSSDTTGVRGIRITVNGTTVPNARQMAAAFSGTHSSSFSTKLQLVAGDVLNVELWQSSGGDLSASHVADSRCHFGLSYITA